MNKIDLSDERYLVIDNPKENLDHLYTKLFDEVYKSKIHSVKLSGFKSLPKEDFVKAVANYLELGNDTIKWIDFQIAHINKRVVWDTETGNMFTIE